MSPRRRRSRRPRRRIDFGPIVATVLTVAAAGAGVAYASGDDEVTVQRVIDGDTFVTADGDRVRVLGIDSCERSEPGGPRATAAAEELLARQTVTLGEEPGVDEDRFERKLRYVTLPDGRDFALAMVGADHTTIYPDGDAAPEREAELAAADGVPGERCNR